MKTRKGFEVLLLSFNYKFLVYRFSVSCYVLCVVMSKLLTFRLLTHYWLNSLSSFILGFGKHLPVLRWTSCGIIKTFRIFNPGDVRDIQLYFHSDFHFPDRLANPSSIWEFKEGSDFPRIVHRCSGVVFYHRGEKLLTFYVL